MNGNKIHRNMLAASVAFALCGFATTTLAADAMQEDGGSAAQPASSERATTLDALLTLVTVGVFNAVVWYARLHYRLLKPAIEQA